MHFVRSLTFSGIVCALAVLMSCQAALAQVGGTPVQGGAPKATQSVQPTGTGASPGIIFVDVTSDTITTIRTAQNIVTRVALPGEAKEAVCGDLFDPTSNTGSFVINRTGNDVFIKPVASKGQTNLFIKTEREVYNFDLVVVPAAQAFRVVNINLPPYQAQIEQEKATARRAIAEERSQMQRDMDDQLADRKRELDKTSADTLSSEQRRLRAEADRRAGDLAARRFVDGIMQGFPTVPVREKRGTYEQVEVTVDDNAYIFEGKLYVRFRVVNNSAKEITYTEPRLVVRTVDADRPVNASSYTARGDFKVPAGQTAAGVMVFERPALERGERLMFILRGDTKDKVVQLRLLEQPQ